MKKSLIALAVLATTGAAMAQSNVTLYGSIDTSIGSSKIGAPGVASSTSNMFSGNLTATRWGVRGTEDLGGGLKAIFALEQAFDSSDGTQAAGSAFNRMSIVGLTGGFGTVKFGRHDTSFDDIRDLSVSNNIFNSPNFATTEAVAGTTGYAGVGQLADYGDRASNQIRYESPSFGGFSAGFSYGLDEQTAPVERDVTAFNLRYKAGNLDVGYGYQENANEVAASNLEYNTLGAAYNFGSFRISGGWNRVKNQTSRKSDAYSIGAVVPVGAMDFSLGYSTAKAKQGSATFEKGDAFSAAVVYNMSKRTRVYAGLTTGDIENAAGTKVREREVYALGLAHTF
ncbi:MAG: porin [Comamonadaceae bacterium]|nr:MAG: porin [Comamonadaceae bacterium]